MISTSPFGDQERKADPNVKAATEPAGSAHPACFSFVLPALLMAIQYFIWLLLWSQPLAAPQKQGIGVVNPQSLLPRCLEHLDSQD